MDDATMTAYIDAVTSGDEETANRIMTEANQKLDRQIEGIQGRLADLMASVQETSDEQIAQLLDMADLI